MTFVDWIPGIFSALGMLIINSIDKSRLSADNFSYRGDGVAWKARVVLFMGFAAMAGGLAGGVVSLSLPTIPARPAVLEARKTCREDEREGGGEAEEESALTASLAADGPGPQIRRPRISLPYPLVRRCQCHCKLPHFPQVRMHTTPT